MKSLSVAYQIDKQLWGICFQHFRQIQCGKQSDSVRINKIEIRFDAKKEEGKNQNSLRKT